MNNSKLQNLIKAMHKYVSLPKVYNIKIEVTQAQHISIKVIIAVIIKKDIDFWKMNPQVVLNYFQIMLKLIKNNNFLKNNLNNNKDKLMELISYIDSKQY